MTDGAADHPAPVRRPATAEEIRALASPLRLRILRVCLHEEHTNKQIAGALGRDPATTLHHVRRLVDTGFLAALPVRRGTRGSREIPYRATGKSWQLDNPAKDGLLIDTFLEEVALVPVSDVRTSRLGVRMDEATHAEFLDRVMALFEEFRRRSDALAPGCPAKAWSVFLAVHPDPNQH
jgi:DNA-binding transcriptional ArsR family regulator